MLWSLFITFLKIGLFTFGGGYAMIANIREDIVEKRSWLDDDELTQIIAIAESTPGPIAINLATFVGYKKRGFWGSFVSTIGVILPSLVIIYTISIFLDGFMTNKYVAYAFEGIKCAVAFLIIKAGYGMFKKLQKKALSMVIFGAIFLAMLVFEIFAINFSAFFLILIGGIIGITAYVWLADKEAKK